MLPDQRYQRIRALLSNFQQVTTERIATDLAVSRETVRRDVAALESLGELRRIYGGVARTDPEPEAPLKERAKAQREEKRAIARVAAQLLLPGQAVFIDAGSTVSLLAEELASLRGLTVITNSFDVALKLSVPDSQGQQRHSVHVLGGTPTASIAANYGASTVAEILRWRVDWAMLSPVAIAADHGASNYETGEAEVARAMAGQAGHTVILADHSKIGQRSRVGFCPVGGIYQLITDKRARKLAALTALQDAGCSVVLA
ncbi:DeoR/GlpR family transcriptional regulator of sugar metabolism [Rhodoferax ferrireducens]|uniref:DeoR/GlpR family transcriptional regulator of sugar metabolism n=1 Tax=Rhodoferax ferrireducens TaxID=192843 RepID=A0ABU2C2X7_9BURK|nr:DeoR/GlpR family DNA-binding transcription regulator [Rhodoferax ferrireducens]MDR7375673.1 DeoR/GlpR family transcriptional regulator of sugar metabolism [Rhodoferax ferrireducens]